MSTKATRNNSLNVTRDLLKLEGSAWAVIVSCKSKKEDRKSFEKKVKAQFSLVPFEDVTPVVEDEPSLETGDEEEVVPVRQTVRPVCWFGGNSFLWRWETATFSDCGRWRVDQVRQA